MVPFFFFLGAGGRFYSKYLWLAAALVMLGFGVEVDLVCFEIGGLWWVCL